MARTKKGHGSNQRVALVQHHLMLAKALGDVHLMLVRGRYPVRDRDRSRRVVADMLAEVERGVG